MNSNDTRMIFRQLDKLKDNHNTLFCPWCIAIIPDNTPFCCDLMRATCEKWGESRDKMSAKVN